MTARMLGPYQEEMILRLASRRKGISRTEIAERFDVSYHVAGRTIRRLERRGLIWPTDNRRRRSFLYSPCPGAGSVVFKARRQRS